MDNPIAANLLDAIRAIHAGVGDGLNDDEFTRFLQKSELPVEAGFAFLSYCDRFVTLWVPRQDLNCWYPKSGWIAVEKETAARAIARKYELSLCEPPDAVYTGLATQQSHHHHLELSNQRETVIVIHPRYLKVRLFVATDRASFAHAAQRPLALGAKLLQDLAGLYQA